MRCVKAFISAVIYQRDLLWRALQSDWRDRLKNGRWFGISYDRQPRTRVARLLDLSTFRPRYGHGIVDQLFRNAIAETPRDGAYDTMYRLLKNTLDAHHAMQDDAWRASEAREQTCSAESVARHCDAVNEIIAVVDAGQRESKNQPEPEDRTATDAKSAKQKQRKKPGRKRGEGNTRTRDKKLDEEYSKAMNSGEISSQTEFAEKHTTMKRSALSKALKRGRKAREEDGEV